MPLSIAALERRPEENGSLRRSGQIWTRWKCAAGQLARHAVARADDVLPAASLDVIAADHSLDLSRRAGSLAGQAGMAHDAADVIDREACGDWLNAAGPSHETSDRSIGENTMRSLLALSLLIIFGASADAATVHHYRTRHHAVIPPGVASSFAAAPSWTYAPPAPPVPYDYMPSYGSTPSYGGDLSTLGGQPPCGC